MTHSWDPERYLSFADHRGRPFVDLLAQVGAHDPHNVVDLGCGPGNLTALLVQRWPGAQVAGFDSSAEMIARARAQVDGVVFTRADLRDWVADVEPGSVEVLVSNATLQWVPEHLDLLPGLVSAVAPGGWLAIQVPGNFDEPSHTIRCDLAAEAPYAEHTVGVPTPDAFDAATYLRALRGLGCRVDAWETTYLHVLPRGDSDEHPVFTWVSGTGARPTLQALDDELRARFSAEFQGRLTQAYPDDGGAVVLPFRRVFVVAQRSW